MDDMEQILGILDEIVSSVELDDRQAECFVDRLSKIYSNPDFTHSYFEIAKHIEDNMHEDERDSLEVNIDIILNKANECYPPGSIVTKRIGKLADHISLEVIRLSRMDKIKYIGEKASVDLENSRNLLLESKSSVDELKNQVAGFHSQSITILGIFSGLVIGFATSVQFLNETFNNINNVSMHKLLIYIAFIGIVIFNTIFVLMYAISKIANKSIAVLCKNKSCSDCYKCKYLIEKTHKKFPYLLYFNGFMALSIVSICIAKRFGLL